MAKSKKTSSKKSNAKQERQRAEQSAKQYKVDPKLARREAEKQQKIVERTLKASTPGHAHDTGERPKPLGHVAVRL